MKTKILHPGSVPIWLAPDSLRLSRRVAWKTMPGTENKVLVDKESRSAYSHGRWKTVQHAQHVVMLVSTYEIVRKRTLVIDVGVLHREFRAPDGYEWDDARGCPGLVRLADGADYHPTIGALVATQADGTYDSRATVDLMVQYIAINAARRGLGKGEVGDVSDVWVSLRDSLAAGNCEAGSIAFARRFRLDHTRRHPAERLINLAKGTGVEDRVSLAVLQAKAIHRIDMERGFCNL